MPRTLHASQGAYRDHVMNRGDGQADDWPYSSLADPSENAALPDPRPVPRGRQWLEHAKRPQSEAEQRAKP